MAPIGNDHQSAVSQLNRMLSGSGVPEVWIVDVNADALLVYGALCDGTYERHLALERPAQVSVTLLRGAILDLAPLFASEPV